MAWDPVGAPRGSVSALRDLVQVAAALTGCDMAAVVLLGDPSPALVAPRGLPADAIRSAVLLDVVSRDELVALPGVVADAEDRDDPLVRLGVQSIAVAPLATSNGEAIGALCVLSKQRRECSKDVLDGLAAVARQIETSFDRHEEQYHLRDLSVRLAESERVLAQQSEQLTRSNRDLEQFAFYAAHELQAPMRTINAFASVLRDVLRDPAAAEPAVIENIASRVDQEADRMAAQVEGLLAIARLGDGEAVSLTPVAPEQVMSQVVERMHPALLEAGGSIDVQALPAVMADRAGLELIFTNLATNAVRYRSEERPLRLVVSHTQDNGSVSIEFRDNGVGIAPGNLERVFEAFQRVDRAVSGTGLGLTLSRRLAHRMGGQLEVASAVGQWTAFTLTIDAA